MTNSNHPMTTTLAEYFRIPNESLCSFEVDAPNGESGFFRFGSDILCYGQFNSGATATSSSAGKSYDALKDVRLRRGAVRLSFDPAQVIGNLRTERYAAELGATRNGSRIPPFGKKLYYAVRDHLPIWIRRQVQRAYLSDWNRMSFPGWPVDSTVDRLHERILRLSMEAQGVERIPFIWFWPDGACNALVMTHDVETEEGRDFTSSLMELDESYGFKASFQVVPESRYEVPDDYVNEIRQRGFEFNIHDLNHDGLLFQNQEEFRQRAAKINAYGRKYGARGFRSAVMYRNEEWFDAFEFAYDMSIPSVAHLEPQRGGCCTVMPFFIGQILEIPLTTTQDYSIFHIMRDYSIDLWKKQLALIGKSHGLMSFIVHPDYVIERRARKIYTCLLDYLREVVCTKDVWATVPSEVDKWWRARAQMNLVRKADGWEIEGPERHRATVAYAVRKHGELFYELEECTTKVGVER